MWHSCWPVTKSGLHLSGLGARSVSINDPDGGMKYIFIEFVWDLKQTILSRLEK